MPAPTRTLARLAGVLYFVLIACGVAGEGLVRGPLVVPGDPATTAANLVGADTIVRVSILADAVMAVCDVAIGSLLLVLLWRAGPAMALAATAFRLAQAAILGLNLVFIVAALSLAHGVPGVTDGAGLAALALELHGVGYDLGLVFFAVNCGLTAALLRGVGASRWLVAGVGLSGAIYLVGSVLVVVAPAVGELFAAAYVVPLVSELALAGWLLAYDPR